MAKKKSKPALCVCGHGDNVHDDKTGHCFRLVEVEGYSKLCYCPRFIPKPLPPVESKHTKVTD